MYVWKLREIGVTETCRQKCKCDVYVFVCKGKVV